MSGPAAFCNLVSDTDGHITNWVCRGLGCDTGWLDARYCTVGFMLDGKLLGGLIYHDIRPGRDLYWTIYTTDKRWCSRRTLKAVFGLAFDLWRVKRISLLVSTDNRACLNLVKKLGFRQEGLLRRYRDDGTDCFLMGMLKEERRF